jgi:arylamine N-acetyltransferase
LDIRRYLERINYHGSLEPTLQTLRALHEAHLLAVPFENLDIHLGTSPESHFTQKRICSLATRSGRISLSDLRLITTIGGKRTERLLTDEEYQTVLAEQFGMVLF